MESRNLMKTSECAKGQQSYDMNHFMRSVTHAGRDQLQQLHDIYCSGGFVVERIACEAEESHNLIPNTSDSR